MRRPLHFFRLILISSLFLTPFLQAEQKKGEEKKSIPLLTEILLQARSKTVAEPFSLSGEISYKEETLPFTLNIAHQKLLYQWSNPKELFLVNLSKKRPLLLKNQKEMSLLEAHSLIGKTPLSYEDLALSVLYWNSPSFIKKEKIKTLETIKLELTPPLELKNYYSNAFVWLDEKTKAPLKIEFFDSEHRLIKRVEALSLQKINEVWMLKEMRFEFFSKEEDSFKRCYLLLSPNKKQK